MLSKLKMKNFKSFKEETIFDFMVTQDEHLKEVNTVDNILKGVAFYGPNASGKTNTIEALHLLLLLMISTNEIGLIQYHCLFDPEKDFVTDLEYEFIFDLDKVIYKIQIKDGNIYKEELSVNDEIVLQRVGLNATYKSKMNNHVEMKNIEINNNMLAARKASFETGYTEYPPLVKWINYIKNSSYINQSKRGILSQDDKYLLTNYIEQKGITEINEFLDLINYKQKIEYNKNVKKGKLLIETSNKKQIFFTREDMDFTLPQDLESEGNKTLVNILPSVFSTIKENGMLIIDEFDSSFHNELEELLLEYFMKKSPKSQMFFTAHSTNLLTSLLLRADQIYTIEYFPKKGSIKKRFSDENPRITQDWEKMYLSGIFDGLSNYNKEF